MSLIPLFMINKERQTKSLNFLLTISFQTRNFHASCFFSSQITAWLNKLWSQMIKFFFRKNIICDLKTMKWIKKYFSSPSSNSYSMSIIEFIFFMNSLGELAKSEQNSSIFYEFTFFLKKIISIIILIITTITIIRWRH